VTGPHDTIAPGSRVRLVRINEITLADDPRTYAYLTTEYVSQIFDVEGMR